MTEDNIKFSLSIDDESNNTISLNADFNGHVICVKVNNHMNINEFDAVIDVFTKSIRHYVAKLIHEDSIK